MSKEIEFSFLEPSDLMLKSEYDSNGDGIVDLAKELEGADSALDGTIYGKFGGQTGFYPAPSTIESLSDLSDVSTTGVTNGQTLVYNSTTGVFEPSSVSGGGASELNDLSDVDTTGAITNQTLKYNGSTWVPAIVDYSELSGTPVLFDGDYNSLSNTPTLFDGDYNSLSNTPTLFDGDYNSLSNTPSIPTSVGDLTDVSISGISAGQVLQWDGASFIPATVSGGSSPTLLGELTNVDTDGQSANNVLKYNGTIWVPSSVSYNELSDQPTLFDGDYNSLSNTPTLFDGDYNSLSNTPTLFDGDYNSLSNTPTLFDGDYNSLSNTPSIPTSVGDLTDVSISGISAGQVLQWDGASFIPATVSGGGASELNDLSDVDTTGAITNQTLKYNGSTWVPAIVDYSELSGTPVLFDGDYNSLSNRPSVPVFIDDLSDVSTTGVSNGQALVYNSALGRFEPGTVSGGGGASELNDLSDVDTATVAPTTGDVLTYNGNDWVPQAISGGTGATNYEWVELWYTSGAGGDLTAPDAVKNHTPGVNVNIVDGAGSIVQFTFNGKSYPPFAIYHYGHATTANAYIMGTPTGGTRTVTGGGANYTETDLFSGTFDNVIELDCAMTRVGASAGLGQRARVYFMFAFGE